MARILIVDSNKLASDFIARALTKSGHCVSTSSTVDSARQWLELAGNFANLIIVDVGVRAFKGLEFVQLLKSREDFKEIPVLVQSKSVNCDFFSFCDGSLRKPYSGKDLIDQISLLIGSDAGMGSEIL